EFLDDGVREGGWTVPVRFRIDGKCALPAARIHRERGAEVLRQLRTDPADGAQRLRAHGVVAANTGWRETAVEARLNGAVPGGLRVEPTARGPRAIGVGVAHAGRRDVADGGIGEGSDHLG